MERLQGTTSLPGVFADISGCCSTLARIHTDRERDALKHDYAPREFESYLIARCIVAVKKICFEESGAMEAQPAIEGSRWAARSQTLPDVTALDAALGTSQLRKYRKELTRYRLPVSDKNDGDVRMRLGCLHRDGAGE